MDDKKELAFEAIKLLTQDGNKVSVKTISTMLGNKISKVTLHKYVDILEAQGSIKVENIGTAKLISLCKTTDTTTQ